MHKITDVVDTFLHTGNLTGEQFVLLLNHAHDREVFSVLQQKAMEVRRQYYGDKVYIRGLIEFTNYCKNNCYYCGIRRGNPQVNRYRLREEEIFACCREGYELGYRTFVLQGGEDPYFTAARMENIIRKIKGDYPDCALTLSVGEKDKATYALWKRAGADRYLLRHETANAAHYAALHPGEMKLEHRKQCLYTLKALGYQVGAGFMVGAPGQTLEYLAQDLLFLKDLEPEMVGIGPFIPHQATQFAGEKAGSVELTIFLLAVIRILLPRVLLPATTALGTMDERGREKGLLAGANVIMPNLSPEKNRKDYSLYDNKISTGEEAAQSIERLKKRVESVGMYVVTQRGDAI